MGEDHSSMNVVCTDECGQYAVCNLCVLNWHETVTTSLATSRTICLVKLKVSKHKEDSCYFVVIMIIIKRTLSEVSSTLARTIHYC